MTHKKVLICVLNWGLGHATRCIPIIRELQRQNAEVSLASDGRALGLLQKEFPDLATYSLPAYNVSYRTGNMFLNIAPQLPKILRAVLAEKKELQRLIAAHQFDCVISDNRFGCYSRQVPSIFMTHQLRIKMPFVLLERVVAYVNQLFIKKFNTCWIPDTAEKPNLSGKLSHDIKGIQTKFIGVLSRIKKINIAQAYDVLIILSGPEPQRTILEEILTEQALGLEKKVLIVQGKTEHSSHVFLNDSTEVISFLTSEKLSEVMSATEIIISRSGYSTIMDLAMINKNAILIPTPGQTEQEYLADNLKKEGIFYSQTQKDFDLESALINAEKYSGFGDEFAENKNLSKVVKELLDFMNEI